MIVKGICNLLFGTVLLLLRLIPRFPSIPGLDANLSPIFYVLQVVNQFVSLPLVGRCALIVLVIYNLKFGWSIIMWLIRKIPGVS